ncbi:hypothetical protein QKU48_gp0211 [Fadolivirus algeromassiliense]|jgi:superfamily II RNA helicase|uniref:Uncharacterized protein n=1 Tax=Fadolivirus FV1/VV64 TaxID=3070911 RepID=A0A7D3UUQ1_9VIRU|nr:hypothetical protein QKU48_gp0211 [Fadolivirus algeromassiliense]QKF93669.1 hypothetical protein Fadolivirus_1_211 [Fadolivirus FV1/VV64]
MENKKRLPQQQPLKHNINVVQNEEQKQKKQLRITRKTELHENKKNNLEQENSTVVEPKEIKESTKQQALKVVPKPNTKPSFSLVQHCSGPSCSRPNKPLQHVTANEHHVDTNEQQNEVENKQNNENNTNEDTHTEECVCGECKQEN